MERDIIMGYCIYHKKSDENLRFEKKEHIIPAGLGGILTLEKGTVSDEANEEFSKLEVRALRNSFISINRMNFGPGKRGSFNVKRIKSPVMRVLRNEEVNPEDFLLGFIFMGQNYIIPQITIHFDGDIIRTNYISNTLIEKSIDNFNEKLIQFFQNAKRTFKSVQMPFIYMPYRINKHFINIGYYQGKWYIATSHKKLNLNFVAFNLLPTLTKGTSNKLTKPKLIDNVNLRYKDRIDTDPTTFYFLYLKTAFNALTLFKGTQFVCDKIFDEIRENIIKLGDLNKFVLQNDKAIHNQIEKYINNFPDKAHYVIISTQDNLLIAHVSFYGELPGRFILTDKYQGKKFMDGFICDWQNRKESRLKDY